MVYLIYDRTDPYFSPYDPTARLYKKDTLDYIGEDEQTFIDLMSKSGVYDDGIYKVESVPETLEDFKALGKRCEYLVTLRSDPFKLPVASFFTAKDCAKWLGVTPRHFSRETSQRCFGYIGQYEVLKVAI